MARSELRRRVDALEGSSTGYSGPAIWVVCEPGETTEQAIARYEAKHGSRLPDQWAVVWRPVMTGVPRGEDSICVA
jgi:hypothetical protein